VAAVALAGLLWIGWRGAGPLPPLGPLVDPVRGTWGLAVTAAPPRHAEARIPGLGSDVRVVYDDRAVPHIFATTELDATRALGYVTARDRLFQLDLQARAGGGTLTELLGGGALELDREVRELGMGRAAERLLAALPDTSEARRSLEAYSAGVNAYLDSLPARELPLEYRLLRAQPTRWSPLRTLQVLQRMNFILARSDVELRYLRAAAVVGDAGAAALFPLHSPVQEPIQPSREEPRRLPATVPPPGAPDPLAAMLATAPAGDRPHAPRAEAGDLGSNNWAVAPARTRDGVALLAGDPHLDLTLPSIWYEAHLVVPGVEDAYGVTIPGLPVIVLGFNRDVAWTFTNTEADLMDRWVEAVDDSVRPRHYRMDGAWRAIEWRPEAYLGPGGDTLALDTVRFSHRGPMRRVGSRWLSMRWTALESGGAPSGLQRAARARTVREWLDQTASYLAPPQNMLVADRAGTIGVRSTGRFPIRTGDGRGDRLLDGTTGASDWSGDWPVAEYPQSVAPAQGYLASANQEPIDPRDGSRYLGSDWPAPWRALRINQLLRGDSAVTTESMRQWQTDAGSARADAWVPYYLRAAAARPADTALAHAARLLAAWDRRYTLDNEGAVLFEAAVRATTARLWDELPPEDSPGAGALIALLEDPTNAWWDERRTVSTVERRDDVLSAALAEAYTYVVRQYGPPEFHGWAWSRVHRIGIRHLLGIPALSALDVAVPGGPGTMSPSSTTGGNEGASWRMVVSLGPEVRAWGTYPGGQSGNPLSPRYDDRLQEWARGELSELRVPRTARDIVAAAELVLRSGP
jgi:penicillin G amidase